MPKLLLTEISVSKFKPPIEVKQVDYWDTKVPAFGLRVSSKGTKSWQVLTRVLNKGEWKQTRVAIGKYPYVKLKEARVAATEIKLKAHRGEDPRYQRIQEREEILQISKNTFGRVREKFLRLHGSTLRQSSLAVYTSILKSKDFEDWEDRPIEAITKREIVELIDEVSKRAPTQANRYLQYLKVLMNWAASRDIIQHRPTDSVKKPNKEISRDRILSETEFKLIWEAFDTDEIFGPLFKLLALTGQRLREVSNMRWDELHNLKSKEPIWILGRERTKMDREHMVPLSKLAVETVKCIPRISDEFVFSTNGETSVSGFSRAKKRVDRTVQGLIAERKIKNVFKKEWILHDLRRTVATNMAEMGCDRDVVELILNHQSGSRSGVAGVYNRSARLADRRLALDNWGERVCEQVNEENKLNLNNLKPFKRENEFKIELGQGAL